MTLDDMKHILVDSMGSQIYFYYALALSGCSYGFPFNSDLLMILGGSLASMGYMDLKWVLILSPLAIFCGDSIIFNVGRKFGHRILGNRFILRLFPTKRQSTVRNVLQNNSKRFIFSIRFFPGLRSFIFIMAGSMQVPARTFYQMNGLSTLLYTPVLITVSYLAAHQLQSIVTGFQGFAKGVITLVIVVALFLVLKQIVRRYWMQESEEKA